MSIDESKDYDLLDRLASEFADRLRRGERPTVREYAEKYPALADLIREAFPALVTVGEVEEIVQDREQSKAPAPAPAQVGDYRIIREVGHGGMGVVYEAEQVSLGRRVALKVLPRHAALDHTALERFRREARASARLHHTNIVPVFEIGHEGDVQYYAMQFIQGQSLDLVIGELRRLRGRSLRGNSRRPTAVGHKEARPDDSGTIGLAGALGVARSLLTGQFDPDPAAPPAGGEVPTASNGPAPAATASPTDSDASAVMPGGAQLSSVETRHRVLHRGVAQIGRQVALALAYAHARGILHRDIKPSNLLLDTEGVVWVSDFGLAKVDDDALTRTGDILGTLRYMAPERFRGRGDARADVYSLGLTLYELLTLRPAFDSPDRLALSEQIKSVEPPRPRSIDPRIPRDLETIVLKAIEKDAGDRYETAEAMGEDLRRFLGDEPILARRVAAHERTLRWARRNPVIAVLGGALTALLLLATISSLLVARRMTTLAGVNEREKLKAEAERQRAEQHLYIARIGQAEGALRLFDSATARGLLEQCRPGPGEPDRRGWEWFYLDQWCTPELRTLTLPTATETNALAMSPDGRLLAVGCSAPYAENTGAFPPVSVYLVSVSDGRVQHELGGHKRYVFAIAFRPDGKCLASLGNEGTIRVWDTESGRELRAISLDTRSRPIVGGLSWSPDGRWLASTFVDGLVRICDAETGRETARVAHSARFVAWSPVGTRIAWGGEEDLEVHGWDARDGRPQGPVFRRAVAVDSLAWSPDGRRLAAGSFDFESEGDSPPWALSVWDAASGERLFHEVHATEIRSVTFSPDGSRVATGGKEGIVRVFGAEHGRERAALFTGCTIVAGLAFGPAGRRLYASGWGMGGVKIFDPTRDPRGRGIQPWPDQVAALTFDREGLRILGIEWLGGGLVSADVAGETARADRRLPVTNVRRYPRGDFAFSRDGRWLAAPLRRDRTVVEVWDVAVGGSVARLRRSGGPVSAVAFGPDGHALATASSGGPEGGPVVTVWHLPSGRMIRTFESGPDPVLALALSSDGRKLAAGGGTSPSAPGWVTAWDAETGAVLGTLDRVGYVMFLAFHPDSARLAVADFGGAKVHLWDLVAGKLVAHPGPDQVSCVGFTPDGKRLAALGYDGNVHLADARSGDEVLVLRRFGPPIGPYGYTPRMAFSPDGSRIAGHYTTHGAILNLWDLGPASGLGVEPAAGDVAGWLRRSRALAERGDVVRAEDAFARARDLDIKGGDPSPWIEHAISLWHQGDSSQARDALARARDAMPDDPERWVDLGRLLERVGRTKESKTALAKARALAERRLSSAPDDEATAETLAGLLADADPSPVWTIIKPTQVKSEGGATLTLLDDCSVLAGGKNPDRDVYSLVAQTDLKQISAIRLEALPDPSLPGGGPGRSASGNFNLGELRVFSRGHRVTLTNMLVAHDQAGEFRNAIAGRFHGTLGWSNHPRHGSPNTAIVATRLERAVDDELIIEMSFSPAPLWPHQGLGRFRLSVTNRPFALLEPNLGWRNADGEQNSLTRLGAAYGLLGDWTSSVAVLGRAAARPDSPAIDGFLLALARHHLGRVDEARRDCDRVLARLAGVLADEATHDMAVEALMAIRGLELDEAEALLQDLVFPASPFGPF
jgi:serine/threonine protein kinase/WD40 repeat protein/tetratricopeptide (TPR) repeat protein